MAPSYQKVADYLTKTHEEEQTKRIQEIRRRR